MTRLVLRATGHLLALRDNGIRPFDFCTDHSKISIL